MASQGPPPGVPAGRRASLELSPAPPSQRHAGHAGLALSCASCREGPTPCACKKLLTDGFSVGPKGPLLTPGGGAAWASRQPWGVSLPPAPGGSHCPPRPSSSGGFSGTRPPRRPPRRTPWGFPSAPTCGLARPSPQLRGEGVFIGSPLQTRVTHGNPRGRFQRQGLGTTRGTRCGRVDTRSCSVHEVVPRHENTLRTGKCTAHRRL